MLSTLTQNWWAVALRGLAAILFGVLALALPGITLSALVLLFGAYAFVDGVFAVVAGIRSRSENDRWWAVLLEGIAGIVLGLLTLLYPGITALVLVYFIAGWAVVTGVLEIVAAVQLRKVITNEWSMILAGILSVAFGGLLAVAPGAGALSLVWAIGAYAIVFGVLLIVLGFRLRGMSKAIEKTSVAGTAHV